MAALSRARISGVGLGPAVQAGDLEHVLDVAPVVERVADARVTNAEPLAEERLDEAGDLRGRRDVGPTARGVLRARRRTRRRSCSASRGRARGRGGWCRRAPAGSARRCDAARGSAPRPPPAGSRWPRRRGRDGDPRCTPRARRPSRRRRSARCRCGACRCARARGRRACPSPRGCVWSARDRRPSRCRSR